MKKETKYYNVAKLAEFFDKTPAWVYWCINNGRFSYENGDPIMPSKSSSKGSRKEYDLDRVQEISLSLYRFGQLDEAGLRRVTAKILSEREAEL